MKKHLIAIITGIGLVLLGAICFNIETKNYSKNDNITSNFNLKYKYFKHQIDADTKYRITNKDADINMSVFIDNSLGNEINIAVEYVDLLNIKNEYKSKKIDGKEIININLESELDLELSDLTNFYILGITSLNNKVKYNYSLFSYPRVVVYVNEAYRSNIEFVNSYGKTYIPVK